MGSATGGQATAPNLMPAPHVVLTRCTRRRGCRIAACSICCYFTRLPGSRTWLALQTQRMSIAVHFATAYQIARELDLAGPEDAAAFLGGEDADA